MRKLIIVFAVCVFSGCEQKHETSWMYQATDRISKVESRLDDLEASPRKIPVEFDISPKLDFNILEDEGTELTLERPQEAMDADAAGIAAPVFDPQLDRLESLIDRLEVAVEKASTKVDVPAEPKRDQLVPEPPIGRILPVQQYVPAANPIGASFGPIVYPAPCLNGCPTPARVNQ